MSYRIFWGHVFDDRVVEGSGTDRAEIEALLGRAWPKAAWAEVFDEHGVAVARQSAGSRGLAGFPGARGWGHVCEACRVQLGQNYRYAPAHPGLRCIPDTTDHPSYTCRNCRAELGFEQREADHPAVWGVLAWPDMQA